MKNLRKLQSLARRIVAAGDSAQARDVEALRDHWQELDPEERRSLYGWMATELEVDRQDLDRSVEQLAEAGEEPGARRDALESVRRAVASPRRSLVESFGQLSGGVEQVLELRAEVLEAQRAGVEGLEPLEEDIAAVLTGWFRHGFLRLGEIDRHSPFEQIRFLKERELVHPMVGLEEMGNRLGADRRCFGLFHCLMPDQPAVFIEVALSRGLVRSIHSIIDPGPGDGAGPAAKPDTAVFYSINNAQHGLAGLGLGKVLVFRVVEALRRSHPSVRTFATLSPVPGFWPRYLKPILSGAATPGGLDRDDALASFSATAQRVVLERWGATGGGTDASLSEALIGLLDGPDWLDDEALAAALRRPLCDLVFRYLREETDARGKRLNPVAGFHLGNGATLARRNVNFAANRSPRGLAESCGIMVNYLYTSSWLQQIGRTVQSVLPFLR